MCISSRLSILARSSVIGIAFAMTAILYCLNTSTLLAHTSLTFLSDTIFSPNELSLYFFILIMRHHAFMSRDASSLTFAR